MRRWLPGLLAIVVLGAAWLQAGENVVIVFDLHKTDASPLRGSPSLE